MHYEFLCPHTVTNIPDFLDLPLRDHPQNNAGFSIFHFPSNNPDRVALLPHHIISWKKQTHGHHIYFFELFFRPHTFVYESDYHLLQNQFLHISFDAITLELQTVYI